MITLNPDSGGSGTLTLTVGAGGLSMGDVPVLQPDPAEQVLMSIPYTLTGPAVDNPQNLVVMHIDESGGTSIIPGSQYNRETGTMDFSTNLFGCFVILYQP